MLKYLPIWNLFDRIWHLKALDFNSTCIWKTEQEQEYEITRGSCLKDCQLEAFLRMIQVSIPQEDYNYINANVILGLNESRQITYIRTN